MSNLKSNRAIITARRVKKNGREINGRLRTLADSDSVSPSWSRYGDNVERFGISIRMHDGEGDTTEYVNVYVSRDIALSIVGYWNEKLTETES